MRELVLQLMAEADRAPRGSLSTASGPLRLQHFAATIAVVAGALTLIGQVGGLDLLTRWVPSSHSMNPITAVMLMLGGAVLLVPEGRLRQAAPIVAGALILVGGGKMVQNALGLPFGPDQYVARALGNGTAAVLPDSIAPNSAFVLFLLGGALWIGRTKRPEWAIAAQVLSGAAVVIALFALIGFTLDAATINHITFNRMAVNSAVGLGALGFGIMCLNPQHGIMRLLAHEGATGDLARKVLPICLLVPPLLGVVRLWSQKAFGISTGDGVVIMVAGNILLSLSLLWGCLILLLRNAAELRAFALAVARSEEQYRVAERISHACHWQFDVARRKLFWSSEFRATLRLPSGAPPTLKAMLDLIHPDDAPDFRKLLCGVLGADVQWDYQLRIRHSDGTIQHVRSHGVCTRDSNGRLTSVFGVIAEVTELVIARQEAEAATHAQAAFLANMSHEIRTPLNGVIGFVDLLIESKLDKTQRRYLSLVSESAQSLLKLLNDILDLSKVEAGELDISAAPTDLRRTIRHAVRLMAPLAEQRQVELSVRIDPDFPAGVMIDGARFRQILLNILGNALKFTEQGSVVVSLDRIEASDGSALIRTTIADSGVGIPKDRQQIVFQPFVQADDSTSRRFGGSGLGLSISRQLAERMGGTIALDSSVETGTTVVITLPLQPAEGAPEDGHESPASLVNGGSEGISEVVEQARSRGGLTVLLVEDFEVNRQLVAAMLERLGHRVEFAHNGAEAVELAGRLRPQPDAWDLILMDIQMPVLNGWEAAARIRALGGAAETIPIVALSANAYAAEIQQSRDFGMNDHVVKPIGFRDLNRIVERWGRGEHASKPPPA